MPLVFISHSSQNDEDVTRFAADLRAAGVTPWVDHESIGPGDDWDLAIERALDVADAMIVVLTPDAVKSDEVRSEWRYFIKHGKPLYPVMFDLCKIPYRLEAFQRVDFTRRALTILRKLVREMLRDASAPDASGSAPKSESSDGPFVPINPSNARQVIPVRVLTGHRGAVRGVAFSPDGSLLASCAEDSSVRLWYTTGRKPIRPLIGHEKPVLAVAFSPDGAQIVSGSEDGTLRLWDVKKRFCLTALRGHTAKVVGVGMYTVGPTVISGSADGTVRLWSIVGRAEVGQLSKAGTPSASPAVAATGLWTAVPVTDPPQVHLFGTLQGPPELSIDLPAPPNSVAFNWVGSLLAVGMEGGGLVVWDVMRKREQIASMTYADYNANCVRGVAFSPDGSLLALGSLDGLVRLWRVDHLLDGKRSALRSLDSHESGVSAVTFSADGTLLASASLDGTARLWAVPE